MNLTHERLKEVLDYNSETGVFTRKIPSKGHGVGVISTFPNKDGYLRIGIDGKRYYAHRLAWFYIHGEWPSDDIDHCFHNRADNRMSKLRNVSTSGNLQNQVNPHSDNKVGFLGVCFHKKAGKFMASIYVSGKQKYLGLFHTAELAHAAYIKAKRIHHQTCMI